MREVGEEIGIEFSFFSLEKGLGLLVFVLRPRAVQSLSVNDKDFAKPSPSSLPLPLPFPLMIWQGGEFEFEFARGVRGKDSSGPEVLLVLVSVERYEV